MLPQARKNRLNGEHRSEYATHSDFCAAFREQLDRLFLLALLLSGDELTAEKCLLTAFDTCVDGSLVFRESTASCSRRSVIKTAIRFTLRASSDSSHSDLVGNRTELDLNHDASLKRVQELSPFDRFVFVMSVLERYSDRECSLLLDCAIGDILPARIRAFQQISRLEKRYPVHSSEAQPYVVDPDWLECG